MTPGEQDFSSIREILKFALEEPASSQLRYLRQAQFRALETYWYLRLVLNTPRIPELYTALFPSKSALRAAMGLNSKALTELMADIPFDRLLPPRLHKPFAASLKLTFTRDGDKQIPITLGSSFNVIVTNTEKIRVQKPTVRAGSSQRLALYCPNLEVRDELRPAIESALLAHGIGPDTLLAVDNKSSDATRRDFEAVARDPAAPHRVLLLVNMGTEGWNCPSLFACALVRKLSLSNNFVLQAATHCLRQVPGNMFANTAVLDEGKKTVRDFISQRHDGSGLLS